MTKLQALGSGSDIVDKIKKHSRDLELSFAAIKVLTRANTSDKMAYKNDMEWASHHYKLLKFEVKIGAALVSVSEPKRKRATDPDAASAKKSKKK